MRESLTHSKPCKLILKVAGKSASTTGLSGGPIRNFRRWFFFLFFHVLLMLHLGEPGLTKLYLCIMWTHCRRLTYCSLIFWQIRAEPEVNFLLRGNCTTNAHIHLCCERKSYLQGAATLAWRLSTRFIIWILYYWTLKEMSSSQYVSIISPWIMGYNEVQSIQSMQITSNSFIWHTWICILKKNECINK